MRISAKARLGALAARLAVATATATVVGGAGTATAADSFSFGYSKLLGRCRHLGQEQHLGRVGGERHLAEGPRRR
ncbi:hypothetical protein [Streptomyces scabiei]|uniref:hypothetical protein n=1 Tax=Streptomyces scabiei TaxID=1930 RepID=UPI0029BA18AB|nr:hypothetical protein [Streptomyces scabiei]MDX3520913.1 hypothetical protein [Streptomyces scabiei]